MRTAEAAIDNVKIRKIFFQSSPRANAGTADEYDPAHFRRKLAIGFFESLDFLFPLLRSRRAVVAADVRERENKLSAVEDAILANDTFERLMGDDVEPRRLFIEENAKFVSNLDI